MIGWPLSNERCHSMLLPYLAQVQLSDKSIRMIPIAAENPEQALALAGRMCIEQGQNDAVIMALLGEEDIAQASGLIETIKEEIKRQEQELEGAPESD